MFIFNNPVPAFGSLVGFFVAFVSGGWEYAVGYAGAYAPLAFVRRAMWTYHYELPLIFGVLGLCTAVGRLGAGVRRAAVFGLAALAAAAFAAWAPWVYDVPVSVRWHRKLALWKRLKIA
jgi:dolichyl-phosphate-mannose--protein O-mannosyl transferase